MGLISLYKYNQGLFSAWDIEDKIKSVVKRDSQTIVLGMDEAVSHPTRPD
jgi:hypothetical protein